MTFNVKCDPSFNYDDIINIMNTELDIPVVTLNNLPETILNILMGTRQVREGSKPSIEYQYDALQKIKQSIANGHNISVIIPAGPKKPGIHGNYIDLAEFWFLKILNELGNKVRSIYPSGVIFTIILEDATMALFEPEMDQQLSADYRDSMNDLIRTLGFAQNVQVISESFLVTSEDLARVGNEVLSELNYYIMAAIKGQMEVAIHSMEKLLELGWKGGISQETLDYYLQSFRKNYPEKTEPEIRYAIALYLATSFARYKLNARKLTDFDIVAANAKRVPGVAFAKYNRIFYRTMPLSKTKTHIPFWRSRGIIEIEGNEYLSKLFPFNATPETEDNVVTFSNKNDDSVTLRIDIKAE